MDRVQFFLLTTFFASYAYAADFTVADGQTVTATQQLSDNDDVGLIESGGTIETTNEDGVLMNSTGGTVTGQSVTNNGTITVSGSGVEGIHNFPGGNEATIVNNGTITTLNDTTEGIESRGTSCTVTNTGTITTFGDNSEGIENEGDSNVITNSGTITTSGEDSEGILCVGVSNVITNSGTITTSGDDSEGIENTGNSATITNNGTITTSGNNAEAIENSGDSVTILNNGTLTTSTNSAEGIFNSGNSTSITNRGTITTSGNSAEGIFSTGSSAVILNSGTITSSSGNNTGINSSGTFAQITNQGIIVAEGSGSVAVRCSGDTSTVINSGTIRSELSHAVEFTSTNPTLKLLRGSNLQGTVESSTDPLNVTVENGQNLRLTITDNSNSFGTLDIDMPFITVGNTETLATVDPTSFALQADILEDLSDAILNDLYRSELPFLECCFPKCHLWIEGIGTSRKRDRSIGTRNWQGGFLAGGTTSLCHQNALSLFVGTSWGTGRVENDTASANSESYYGGFAYEQLCCGTFFGWSAVGGYFGLDTRREIVFNLAPNGEEEAKAEGKGGIFLTELYASRWLMRPCSFRPLVRGALRYSALFLGDYDESGSSSDLFVKNRHIGLLKVKGECALTKEGCWCKHAYFLSPYLGVAGRFQLSGNRVESTLLGQDLNFETGGPENVAEILYGLYGNLQGGRYTLFFHVQGLRDTEQSSRFLGEGGVAYQF